MKIFFTYILIPLCSIAAFYIYAFFIQFVNVYTIPPESILVFTFFPQFVLGILQTNRKQVIKVNIFSSLLMAVFLGYITTGHGGEFEDSAQSDGFDIGFTLTTAIFSFFPIVLLGVSSTVLGIVVRRTVNRRIMLASKNKHFMKKKYATIKSIWMQTHLP